MKISSSLTIISLILLSFLLSGCSLLSRSADNAPLDSGAVAIPTLAESGLAGVNLSNVNLSGQSDPDLPGVKIPALAFGASGASDTSDTSLLVASGRIIPVADKDGKQIVGWRILGEIYNGGKELIKNAQMLVELVQNDSTTKNLLPESVQSGGFIPVKSADRGVYDLLISAASLSTPGEEFSADRISIGVRRLAEPNELVRLDVRDIKFTPQGDSYKVGGTIINNLEKPVVGPLVRFWAVVDRGEVPQGARTADQVVAVGTWENPQEILAAGQSKKFETTLNPLTPNDRQLMATISAQLSAASAAKILK